MNFFNKGSKNLLKKIFFSFFLWGRGGGERGDKGGAG